MKRTGSSRTSLEDLQTLRAARNGLDCIGQRLATGLEAIEGSLNLLGQLGRLLQPRIQDLDFGARLLIGGSRAHGHHPFFLFFLKPETPSLPAKFGAFTKGIRFEGDEGDFVVVLVSNDKL